MSAVLKVQDLSFNYPRGPLIFSKVGFELQAGCVLSILGANGTGKSTLLNCIAGMLRQNTGTIHLEDRNVAGMSLRDIATHIGYVPQIHNPTYAYTVREFVVMGRTPYLRAFASPRKADYEIAEQAIARMNITHLLDKAYTEISGGERQLATIAQAIAQQPKILMLDEPTAHLDYGNQMRTMRLIRSLAEEGYSIIFTTHIPDHPLFLGGDVAVFNKKTITVGNATDILTSAALSELYDISVKTTEVNGRRICYAE